MENQWNPGWWCTRICRVHPCLPCMSLVLTLVHPCPGYIPGPCWLPGQAGPRVHGTAHQPEGSPEARTRNWPLVGVLHEVQCQIRIYPDFMEITGFYGNYRRNYRCFRHYSSNYGNFGWKQSFLGILTKNSHFSAFWTTFGRTVHFWIMNAGLGGLFSQNGLKVTSKISTFSRKSVKIGKFNMKSGPFSSIFMTLGWSFLSPISRIYNPGQFFEGKLNKVQLLLFTSHTLKMTKMVDFDDNFWHLKT